jgi:PAS domain S-box-containing protein
MTDSPDQTISDLRKTIRDLETSLQVCGEETERLRQENAELEAVHGSALADLRRAQFQIDNLNSVVLQWDPSGKITFLNAFGKSLFGFSDEEIIGKPLVGTIVAETDSAGHDLKIMIEDIVKNPQKYKRNENENITKSGDRLWMFWRNKPIFDSDGSLKEILTVGYDITAKKREEKALAESEDLLKNVLNNMPATVFLKTIDGRMMFVNRQYEEIYNLSLDSIKDKTVYDIYPKDIADDFSKQDRRITEGKKVAHEESTVELNGKTRHFTKILFPVFNAEGEMIAFGGIELDITEQQQIKRQLVEKDDQMRTALESLPGGIVLTDERMNIVIANDRMSEMYGAPADLLEAGRPYADFLRYMGEQGFYGPIDPEAFVAERVEELRDPSGVVSDRRTPDGRLFEIRRQPVGGGGAITVVTDVTEERQVAERFAQQAEALMKLSTPITEVWKGILLLPVIGELDRNRARETMNAVLEMITRTGAKIVILDISGLSTVNEEVIPHVVMIADAASLMGSQCVISGVSPTNARLIVDIGVDVDALFTVATMREALLLGFNRLGYEVRKFEQAEAVRDGGR